MNNNIHFENIDEENKKDVRNLLMTYLKKYDQFLNKIAISVKRKCAKLEFEDIKQQIILALFSNTKTFNIDLYPSANTYFSQVALNAGSNIIKCYWQLKNKANVECLSLDAYIRDEDTEYPLSEIFADNKNSDLNPENYYLNNTLISKLDKIIQSMRPLEKQIFILFMKGLSIEEIANRLKKSKKTIYNFIRLIKLKLKEKI